MILLKIYSQEFCNASLLMRIRMKAIPVEDANSLSTVERYHETLCKSYRLVKGEAPVINGTWALQYALKAVNDSAGPDGLVPTQLVCGSMPRLGLPTDTPAAELLQRAVVVRKAIEALSRHFAFTQVSSALLSRNDPDVFDIHTGLSAHTFWYIVSIPIVGRDLTRSYLVTS